MSPSNFEQPKYDKPYVIQRLWLKPEPGDVLLGTFLGHSYEDAPFGRQSLWGVRENGHERAVPNCAQLDKLFSDLKPKRGQGIAIRYDGKDVNGARGHQYTLKLFPKLDDVAMLNGEALFEDTKKATEEVFGPTTSTRGSDPVTTSGLVEDSTESDELPF